MEKLDREIIEFCKEELGLFDIEIKSETKLEDDLGLSSFELMTMYAQIEENFQIEIDMDEAILIDTVQDLINMVKERIREAI